MKHTKGFIFLETIVVMTVLTTSLILIYSSFNSVVVQEKRRRHYNNSEYVYKSYAVLDFLKDNVTFQNDYNALGASGDNSNKVLIIKKGDPFSSNDSAVVNRKSYTNYQYLDQLFGNYNIEGIYLFNHITKAKNTGEVIEDSDIPATVIDFIRTLSNEAGEVTMVVLYYENMSDETTFQLSSFYANGLMESGIK